MGKKWEDEHNAVAWLKMDNDELARCSASLGHDAEIVPLSSQHDSTAGLARYPTSEEQDALRKAADKVAVEHAGQEFVDEWIKENRK